MVLLLGGDGPGPSAGVVDTVPEVRELRTSLTPPRQCPLQRLLDVTRRLKGSATVLSMQQKPEVETWGREREADRAARFDQDPISEPAVEFGVEDAPDLVAMVVIVQTATPMGLHDHVDVIDLGVDHVEHWTTTGAHALKVTFLGFALTKDKKTLLLDSRAGRLSFKK